MGARFDTVLRNEHQPEAGAGGGTANVPVQHNEQANASTSEAGRQQETQEVATNGGGSPTPLQVKPPPVDYQAQRHIAERIAKREAREQAAKANEGIEARAAKLAQDEAAFNARMASERDMMLNPEKADAYFKSRGFENGFVGLQEKIMQNEGMLAQSKDPRVDSLQAKIEALESERQKIETERASQAAKAAEREEESSIMSVIATDIAASPDYANIAQSEHKLGNGKTMGTVFKNGIYSLLQSGNNPSTGNPWTMPEAMAKTKQSILDTGVAMLASLGHDTSAFGGETPGQSGVTSENPDQGSGTPERTTNLKQGESAEAGARVSPGAEALHIWAARHARNHSNS